MMPGRIRTAALALTCAAVPVFAADGALTRTEVAQVKKALVAAETALTVPAEYVRTAEDFELPVTDNGKTNAGKWIPLSPVVSLRFEGKAAREGERDLKMSEEEFQKKVQAATEKGDYEEVVRLTQRFQEQAIATSGKITSGRKDPLFARIAFNAGEFVQIDPDAVLLEKPGVLAVKRGLEEGSGKLVVTLFVDPVALKNTNDAASVSLATPDEGVERKLGVYAISVRFEGPEAAVLAWVKAANTAALLAIVRGETSSAKPAKK